MPNHVTEIKSMQLYNHIDRVYNELAELGKDRDSPLQAAEISSFDQLHYHGTAAVDHAIEAMNIDAASRVLEIGSGFGGPARHIAQRTRASVTALELQPDQNDLASDLTRRCGLADYVDHRCGDFLTHDWQARKYDHIVSWLAIFHIRERARLLEISRELLKTGGLFFAEDMYSRNPMNAQEKGELETGMYAKYLPDFETYQRDFREAGFEILDCEDMSDDWTAFTTDRLNDYRESRERQLRVHGEPTFNAMEHFYDLVNRHFRSGKLGGVRILARKPQGKTTIV